MKKIRAIVLILSSVFIVTSNAYSQSMTISGGAEYGVVICNKGLVYAWGSNDNKVLGIDPAGPGATPNAAYITKPQLVKMPTLPDGVTPVTMQQVIAGSGSFTVALSCNGVVYAWGGNEYGNCGQGTYTSVVPFPAPVLCGDAPGYHEDGTPGGPYLGGVTFVAAATGSGYAILENGEAVSWGYNKKIVWPATTEAASGQLANGTGVNSNVPTYIKTSASARLTNVTHISGGDYSVYFTAGGTVYSAGHWIGRAGSGLFAQPVKKDTGGNLNNVTMTAAGDGHGVAVDADGYVYGWGNNPWGCCAGIPGNEALATFAKKVVSGAYGKISGEKELTNVVEVIGGRGYTAAITKEGYVLYWGLTESTTPADQGANGGLIGSKYVGKLADGERNTCDDGPQFLFYCTAGDKDTVKNAVHIARGDNFGFMVNDQDEYFAWGKNHKGQLGIGSTTNKRCLSPMTIPCEASDRVPEAYMPPAIKKCFGEAFVLSSGFTVPTGKDGNYKFTWYHTPEGETAETKLTDATSTINTDKTGKYRVEVEYVGDNMTCNSITFAKAETMLTDKEVPLDTLVPLSCVAAPNEKRPISTDEVNFAFKSKYPNQSIPSKFEIYKSQTGGTLIQTVTVSATETETEFVVKGDKVNVERTIPDTLYSVWIEDITTREGTVYKGAAPTNTANTVNRNGGQYSAEKFIISGDIVLKELSINIKNEWNPVSGYVTPQIYKVGSDNNGNDALGAIVGSGQKTAVSTPGGANNQPPVKVTLSFNDLLLTGDPERGTRYILVLKQENTNNLDILYVPFAVGEDDVDGTVLNTISAHQLNGLGNLQQLDNDPKRVVFDWKFETLPMYDCGRIKLTSKYYCPPCNSPAALTINSDDADKTLCPSGSLELTSNNQANATDFTFAWYKVTEDALPTTLPGGTVGITAPAYTVSYADLEGAVGAETTFTLLVRDAANPEAKACFVTKEIKIRKAENPEYTLTVGNPVCAGTTPDGASVEFTKGVAPFEYEFTIDAATPATPGTGAVINTEYLLGTTKGKYKLTALNDKYCAATTLTQEVEVVINDLPAAPITTELTFLKRAGVQESIADAATVLAGHSLLWYTMETGGTGATTAPKHDISTEGTFYYWVSQVNATTGCESARAEVTIVVNNCPIPAPTVAQAEFTICNYDETPTITASKGIGWDGNTAATRPTTGITTSTFKLYDAEGKLLTSNTTGTFTVTIDKAEEKSHVFTVREEIDFDFPTNSEWDDCEGPSTKITINVKKPAAITITPAGEEVCAGTENPLFTANGKATGATIEWYTTPPAINSSNDGSGAVGKADTYRPVLDGVGTKTIYAAQRTTDGCLSEAANQTWKIKAVPAKPTVTDASNCFGKTPNNPVKATGAAGASIKWYKTEDATTVLTNGEAAEYTSTETAVGEYTYYATQTVAGCESTERAAAKFTIVALPKTPTVTISDEEICEYDSDPTFTISNQESGSTVNWYKADKTTLVGSGATYNVDRDNGTTYYATQTTACVSEFSAPITFKIHPKPANPIVVSQVMCANEDIPYLGTDGINDKWFRTADASDVAFNTGKSYRPTATDIGTSDEITFYVKRTENECQSDIIPISLKIIPTPTVEIQGGNKAICLNQEIDVTAHNFTPAYSSTSTLRWTLIDENSSRKPLNETALNTVTLNSTNIVAEGDYTIEVVYNHNYAGKVCTSMPAQVIYTVYPLPNKPIVQDQVRCQSENMEALHAFGSSLITWTSLDGKLPLWIGASYNFAQIGLPSVAVGQYKFELHDIDALTQCESERVQMTFEVAPKAETKIVGETEHCVGTKSSAYTLEQVPQRPSTYEWTISGDRKLYNNDNSTALRYVDWNYSGVDSIWVKETTWAGCEGKDSIAVRVADLPEALFFAERAPNGIETSLQFTNQSTQEPIVFTNEFGNEEREEIPYTMFWNFGKIDLPPFMENYIDTIVEYEQRNIPLVVNDFKYGWARPTLTLENSYGCKSTYATEVFVDITTGFYIPSAFAPSNAASAVRIFKPIAFNLEYCKVWIYDTWGNLLWYGDRVENGMFVDEWNGTYNGELLPAGTYIWHIDAKFLNGKKWKGTRHRTSGNPKVRGSVVLIR